MSFTTAILLAGGTGSRMKRSTPKQFLSLGEKIVARYSFDILEKLACIKAIVVVAAPSYHNFFSSSNPILFAEPGARRQDSVLNAFCKAPKETDLFIVHDAARPLVQPENFVAVIEAAQKHGAAALGHKVTSTMKETDEHGKVLQTLDRSRVWDIQTPQALRADIMKEGFAEATKQGLTVTDDVSLSELIGHAPQLVAGPESNIKLTHPKDLPILEQLLS